MVKNILRVALKEFDNLISNKFTIIIIFVYMIMLLISSYNISIILNLPNISHFQGMTSSDFLNCLAVSLIEYGSVIAAVIGFCSISIEKNGNTLNTLVTKPLYRDTIINGKLIGCAFFLIFISIIVSIMFFFAWTIFMGNIVNVSLDLFMFYLLVILLVSWVCQLIFLSVSILLSIIIKDDIFAMFAGISVYLLMMAYIPNATFAMSLGSIFGYKWTALIASLAPNNLTYGIIKNTVNISGDLVNNFLSYSPAVIVLLIYLTIAVFLSYIVFIRRDVS
ncbi:MAG: ABC-2 family transporter protein [Methanocella sp. PtaU1.Bin125]|nr:MAG: ABC-2 family transporter protein [Methanocella sp. PtaU1.Bin125]